MTHEVKGDIDITRELAHERGLVGPVVRSALGSVTLASTHIGSFITVTPTRGDQTVTLPAASGGTVGAFLEIQNLGQVAMRIVPAGADTISYSSINRMIAPEGRAYCKLTGATQWSISSTYTHGLLLHDLAQVSVGRVYQSTSQQTIPDSVGDPPTIPVTKANLSVGTVNYDTLSMFNAGSDDFTVIHSGLYHVSGTFQVRHAGEGSGNRVFAWISVNDAESALSVAQLPILSLGGMEQVEVSSELFLVAGDTVDFRLGATGTDATLRGFQVKIEQIASALLRDTTCPCLSADQGSEISVVALNAAWPFDDYVQEASGLSKAIEMYGDGLFLLGPGTWLMMACVSFDFNNQAGNVDFRMSDVTGVPNPVTAAGTKFGGTMKLVNGHNFTYVDPNGVMPYVVTVNAGTTKLLKLERVTTGANTISQLEYSHLVIRRLR